MNHTRSVLFADVTSKIAFCMILNPSAESNSTSSNSLDALTNLASPILEGSVSKSSR